MISSIEIKTDRGLKGFKFSHKKKTITSIQLQR